MRAELGLHVRTRKQPAKYADPRISMLRTSPANPSMHFANWTRSIVQARACFAAIAFSACAQADAIELLGVSTVDSAALTFAEGPAARFATSVNGRSHQQVPLTTHRGFQYATYVDAARNICVGRRELPDHPWEVIRFQDHTFRSNDSHNTCVIGICESDGTIHLAFDHHASQLNYRVSRLGAAHQPNTTPWEADLFGDVLHTLGSVIPENRVTYPRFIPAPNGDLMLYYRSVTSGNGDGMIEEYSGRTHDWSPGLGKFIARDIGRYTVDEKTSNYRCPYMNALSFAGTRLHASWVWRDLFERTNPENQHDLCYAYSDDRGRTWQNSTGETIGQTGTDFIHLDSPGVVVVPIPTTARVSNQNTHYAYEDGSIHVVMKQRAAATKERRYHHYWRDNMGVWSQEVLPCSGNRPKLVGNTDRDLVLVYSEEDIRSGTNQLMMLRGFPNAGQTGWSWRQELCHRPIRVVCEPLLDQQRWESERILSVYYQDEPARIVRTKSLAPVDGASSPLNVFDYRFTAKGVLPSEAR